MERLEIEKENFKKDLEEFFSSWEKEAEGLKNRELTEDASQTIRFNYSNARFKFGMFGKMFSLSLSDYRKFDLIESKLETSLAIATSNYRSKHKTISERFVDSVGGLFHIFGKNN